MTLTKPNYKSRIIDKTIERDLKIFGAISIEGPKWCGKTWTALNHANSVVYLNNVENNFNERELAQMDVSLILGKEPPELIDEWQEVPAIWDGIRFKCDEDNKKGKYILTGSATPVAKDIHHSGAGRIKRIKMYPMSLFESGDSNGAAGLQDLFKGTIKNKPVNPIKLNELARLIVRGGWPGVINLNPADSITLSRSYLSDILSFDISNIDGVNRDTNKMWRILRSLARNESTIVNDSTIIKDVEDDISKNTVLDYLDVLRKIYVIEEQPAFSINYRSSSRVGKTAKRHFVDPSLACAALNLSPEKLLEDIRFFGFLFEAMCERDLKIYAESLDGQLYHFRDNQTGMEIDAIVELPSGEYGAFEIKLGTEEIDEAAKKLLKFSRQVARKPKFLCVISGLQQAIIQRQDGVYVLPITALKN